jgi:preprotein translocase subunit SecE
MMDFLKDVRSEMRKVVTPTRPEVQSTTTIVIVTVFIFAAYFAVTDYVFGQGITRLIQYLTKH